jgi:cold shock CspA family protein
MVAELVPRRASDDAPCGHGDRGEDPLETAERDGHRGEDPLQRADPWAKVGDMSGMKSGTVGGMSDGRVSDMNGGDGITLKSIWAELRAMRVLLRERLPLPRSLGVPQKPLVKELEREYDVMPLEEAISRKQYTTAKVTKWFVEKGFGFLLASGKEVFCHASVVHKQEYLEVGSKVVVKIVEDLAQGRGKLKAVSAWKEYDYEEERALEVAQRAAGEAARAAIEMAKKAMEAEIRNEDFVKKRATAKLFSPPGLGQTVGSKLFGQTVGSEMFGQTVGSKLVGQTAGSKLFGQTVGSEMFGQTVGSKLAGQTAGSNLFGQAVVNGTRSSSTRRSCGLSGGPSRVSRRETFAERQQREKEEKERRVAQKAKWKEEEKERDDELVSDLKVQCWELYRCSRRWGDTLNKGMNFDPVTRRADFDQEVAEKSTGRWGDTMKSKEVAEGLEAWRVELEKNTARVEADETKKMERADQEACRQRTWDRIVWPTAASAAAGSSMIGQGTGVEVMVPESDEECASGKDLKDEKGVNRVKNYEG